MLKSQQTGVYDRAQKNGGFITGPKHGLLGDSSRTMRQVDEPATTESAAPNLRVSNGPEDCGGCAHYAEDRCSKYDFSPEPFKVCDSFTTEAAPAEPAAAEPADMLGDPEDYDG